MAKRAEQAGRDQLSNDTVAELRECLGAETAAAILPDFQRMIRHVPTKRSSFARWKNEKTFVQSVEMTRVRGALRATWESLRVRVGDYPEFDGVWESLDRVLTAQIESFKKSEAADRSRRGRPPDNLRIWLANTLFHLLVEHGVRVTKTKGATFERVLIIAIDASRAPGDKATPQDVMPLVRRTIDHWAKFTGTNWTWAHERALDRRAQELWEQA